MQRFAFGVYAVPNTKKSVRTTRVRAEVQLSGELLPGATCKAPGSTPESQSKTETKVQTQSSSYCVES